MRLGDRLAQQDEKNCQFDERIARLENANRELEEMIGRLDKEVDALKAAKAAAGEAEMKVEVGRTAKPPRARKTAGK